MCGLEKAFIYESMQLFIHAFILLSKHSIYLFTCSIHPSMYSLHPSIHLPIHVHIHSSSIRSIIFISPFIQICMKHLLSIYYVPVLHWALGYLNNQIWLLPSWRVCGLISDEKQISKLVVRFPLLQQNT